MPDFSIKAETEVFNRHIADFRKKCNLSAEVVLKKFAFDLLAKIIRKTPVDTGQARGGWIPGLEGLGRGSSKTINVNIQSGSKNFNAEAFSRGQTKGRYIDGTKGPLGFPKYIEIINGVEHVIFLEYGSSKQAPFGMVRLSMREMRKGFLPKNMTEEFQKNWNSFNY
jgi:hypothetical protein